MSTTSCKILQVLRLSIKSRGKVSLKIIKKNQKLTQSLIRSRTLISMTNLNLTKEEIIIITMIRDLLITANLSRTMMLTIKIMEESSMANKIEEIIKVIEIATQDHTMINTMMMVTEDMKNRRIGIIKILIKAEIEEMNTGRMIMGMSTQMTTIFKIPMETERLIMTTTTKLTMGRRMLTTTMMI